MTNDNQLSGEESNSGAKKYALIAFFSAVFYVFSAPMMIFLSMKFFGNHIAAYLSWVYGPVHRLYDTGAPFEGYKDFWFRLIFGP